MKQFSMYLLLVLGAGLPLCVLAQQASTLQLPVKDGADAVYIFFSNESLHTQKNGKVAGGTILRSTNGGSFTQIGKLASATAPGDFKRIAGQNALKVIASLKRLATEQDAWNYVQAHPQLSDYGILAADTRFLEAMGSCYADREVKKMNGVSTVQYKVQLQFYGGGNNTELQGKLTLNQPPVIEKPLLNKVQEQDSGIFIEWKAAAAASPDAMFGEVYRKKGNYGQFEWIGKTFANKDAGQQAVTYTWNEQAEPNHQYYFMVVPTTLTGLRGPASDTASAISVNFKQIEQSGLMTVKDSAGGILLQWQPVKEKTFFAGIVVERSKDPKSGYRAIDTVDANQHAFLDLRILPNIQYHYRIRLLTIRQNLLEPSAFGSAIHKESASMPESPESVVAEGMREGIRIHWRHTMRPDIAGYYVYRQHPDSAGWELVSNLVKDTAYTDSTAQNSRYQYRYAVSAVNHQDVKSEMSNIVVAAVKNSYPLREPTGLNAAADGQRILLRWRDLQPADAFITGYYVYRKTGMIYPDNFHNTAQDLKRNGFEKLTDAPVADAYYTDNHAVQGNYYTYVVTAIDAAGTESNSCLPVVVDPGKAIVIPVAEIAVHKTSAGIVIVWDAPLQQGITGYAVYRRAPDQATAEKIGTVFFGQNAFTDGQARKGKLYFYSVKVLAANAESAASGEKGGRW